MSHASPRSRSPKDNKGSLSKGSDGSADDPESWTEQIWDAICPKMDEKLGGFKTDVKQVVNTLVGKQLERLEKKIENNQQTINNNLQNLEKQMDGKFATMESNLLKAIQECKSASPPPPPAPSGEPGSSGLAGASFSVADAAARYQARPGHSFPPSPPWINDVTTPHFNRAPDATKLFCNIHDRVQVAKTKFREKLQVLVAEAGLNESDFTLVGDALDFRFEMQFTGDIRIASIKAKQFHTSLQLGRGKWKPQLVEDSLGAEHKFYVNPDKNAAQVRKEVLAKRLQSIISPMCPGKDIYIKKSSGTLYNERRAVVSVILTGEESARLDWCQPKRIELKLVQEEVEAAFSHFVVAGGPSS